MHMCGYIYVCVCIHIYIIYRNFHIYKGMFTCIYMKYRADRYFIKLIILPAHI